MAGIGFRLQKVVARGTFLHAATGYCCAAILTAGPVLSAMLALVLLSGATAAFLDQAERALLFTTIMYASALSLVVTGGLQLVLSRYVADRFYLGDHEGVASTCAGTLVAMIPIALLMLPFIVLAPFELRYRLLVASLFLILCLISLMMVFLSAARDYLRLVLVFASCHALSYIAAIGLGRTHGLLGSLGGYVLGQTLCVSLLVSCVYLEFRSPSSVDFAFLLHGRRYWDLLLIVLLYNVGIWIDKVVHWFSQDAVVIANFYRVSPQYDAPMVAAYVFTIPAAAVFLLHLETNFEHYYQAFYRAIEKGGTLAVIVEAKRGMIHAAKEGLSATVKVLSIVALGTIILAPKLAAVAALSPDDVPLLRLGVLAASSQFLLLVSTLLLLYLDERGTVLLVVAVFAVSNAGLTMAAMGLGLGLDGLSYLVAATLGAALGMILLKNRLGRLEYRTFMLQPVGG
jgi:uncharacterized membrane protein